MAFPARSSGQLQAQHRGAHLESHTPLKRSGYTAQGTDLTGKGQAGEGDTY